MGYVFRVRAASFFAGVATASICGMFILHNDYKHAHNKISQQMDGLLETLDQRISAIEKLKRSEDSPKPTESIE